MSNHLHKSASLPQKRTPVFPSQVWTFSHCKVSVVQILPFYQHTSLTATYLLSGRCANFFPSSLPACNLKFHDQDEKKKKYNAIQSPLHSSRLTLNSKTGFGADFSAFFFFFQ